MKNHKKCMPCQFLRKVSNNLKNSINLSRFEPEPEPYTYLLLRRELQRNAPDSPSVLRRSRRNRGAAPAPQRPTMSLLVSSPAFAPQKLRKPGLADRARLNPPSQCPFFGTQMRGIGRSCTGYRRNGVRAFFFNPTEERIIKEALKEPVAFMGGMFAGLLRLDLNEDPLREWVTRTVEASGISEEELDAEGSKEAEEDAPQRIEIE
ncbi:hypothetical protein NL676_022050 [Syzygium grande]|nr:hypothetical protein NL676_022050 [Syzygium grande]